MPTRYYSRSIQSSSPITTVSRSGDAPEYIRISIGKEKSRISFNLNPLIGNTSMPTARSNVTDLVQDFYTEYPYPPPFADQPGYMSGSSLGYSRHVLWPWRSDLAGLRLLDAGCGTGIAAVDTALRHPDIQLTAIDVSPISLSLAKNFADEKGVGDRISYIQMPIEEVESLGEEFDFINCTGVLHHLDDPAKGLMMLRKVLAREGGDPRQLFLPVGRQLFLPV